MLKYFEGLFPMLLIGYLLYASTIKYCLIPMSVQIIFSYFIEKKQVWKIAIMFFCTQGMVIAIVLMLYEIIDSIYNYSGKLGFWNVIISKSFTFNVIYSSIIFSIIIAIGFFMYKSIEGKMCCKKWLTLLMGYAINILIMIFMEFKFGIIVNSF